MRHQKAFTLIEVLAVIGIIAVLSAAAFAFFGNTTVKARDAKRISDLSQIGRFLSFGCLTPDTGPGDFDLNVLMAEFKSKYPQYADRIPGNIRDPKTGTEAVSGYRYEVAAGGQCVLYANLEDNETAVNLPAISEAAPGGGKGVFEAADPGPNGSRKYFQVSN
ncbi:MAG: type II secretion system protein [Candidatus Falkowbacteria bacterium]